MMSKSNDDHLFNLCMYVAVPVAACAVIGHFLQAIQEHFLSPTFKFLLTYFQNYGFKTAILIFFCVLIYWGCKTHLKSIRSVIETFEKETKKREQITADLQKTEADLQRKLSGSAKQTGEQNEKLQQLNREVASLKEQNQILETENERLKNPVAFNLKQKSKIQKENAENLKTLIHQTHWREMK